MVSSIRSDPRERMEESANISVLHPESDGLRTNQTRQIARVWKESHMLAEIFGVDGIVVLIVVVALLFGGAAIPKLARNLGSAKNQFTKGLEEGQRATPSES
jgi:hypothetical protein